MIKPIAIAIRCSLDADIYEVPLFNNLEVSQVRNGEHPDISEDEKVIIVFADMTTESHT